MADSLIPDIYRSDHLFLLIGTNPLPNYVVARLLAKPNATVYLLHSDGAEGSPSTKGIAEQLEISLCSKRTDVTVELRGISDSDNSKIENAVNRIAQQILNENPQASVGLNYTGGTKPMAIHSYRVLERRFSRVVSSYLDPRKLALRIDGWGTQGPQLFYLLKEADLRQEVETSLDELIDLHQYQYSSDEKPEWALPENTPGLLDLCRAIAHVWSEPDRLRQWQHWMGTEKFQALPTADKYPKLESVIQAFDALLAGSGRTTPAAVARLLRPHDPNATLRSCTKWFLGAWLEEYVPDCVNQIAAQLGITSVRLRQRYISKTEAGDAFELDAAMMIGYQLFAISCIATEKKPVAKEHLLEAYVRARQLGGDEARVGLVCCLDNTDALLKEIKRSWDAEGKIWVFGRSALHDLESKTKLWFETANP